MIDPDFKIITLEGRLDTAFEQRLEEALNTIIS